jgi:hypothetical protein
MYGVCCVGVGVGVGVGVSVGVGVGVGACLRARAHSCIHSRSGVFMVFAFLFVCVHAPVCMCT